MTLKYTLAAGLIALAGASSAATMTVTETFESFSSGDTITTQLDGLTVSAEGSGEAMIASASFPVVAGEPLGIYNTSTGPLGTGFELSLTFDFIGVASQIGALVDFGNSGDGLMLEIFDGVGGTGTSLGAASVTTETFLGLSATGIKSAVFSQVGTGATWMLDNLTYTYDDIAPAVPLPAGGLLLLSGLIGGGALARKRKARAA